MAESPTDQHVIRERVLAAVGQILGYQPDPETTHLKDLDSLQVLEFLVLLEEEFDIDSDKIVETPDWWISIDELVTSIKTLIG
jgi:acyl carrier protein